MYSARDRVGPPLGLMHEGTQIIPQYLHSICGSLHILIAMLHSKHCITECILKAGLIHTS